MSNHYVSKLGLNHDPFEPGAPCKEFFGGGGRQALLAELLEKACHGGGLHIVRGDPGSGKTTLARALEKDIGRSGITVTIQATLFMGADAFLEKLTAALDIDTQQADSAARLDSICSRANDLALKARNLIIILDDAHELASEVINLLAKLLRRNSGGGLAVILLGEKSLAGLLENSLPDTLYQAAMSWRLEAFSSEDSFEYIRFKLAGAGYRKPLPLSGGELGQLHSAAAGNPGRLHDKLIKALNLATADPKPEGPTPVTSLLRLGQSYWLVAAGLAAIMMVLLLFRGDPQSNPAPESSRQQIPVAANASQTEPETVESDASPEQLSPETEPQSDVVNNPAPLRPVAPAAVSPPRVASQEPQASTPATEANTQSEEELTAFEVQLLAYGPDTFTLQIMASSSAASIERFLAGESALASAGYYETRLRGEPWFVVVAGQFEQRDAAQAAIARLPASLREMQPFVRSVADIQASIRARQ